MEERRRNYADPLLFARYRRYYRAYAGIRGNKVLTDMLVSKLYEIFSGNTPKPERSVLKHCSKGDEGIWDILGYYDPKSHAIFICEPKVENHSWEIARSLGLTTFYTRLVLRELVRLHEHAHSLTHTGKFDELLGTEFPAELREEVKVRVRFRMRYPIRSEINEPYCRIHILVYYSKYSL